MNYLTPHAKALVPFAVAGVLTLLGYVGIFGEMTVEEALTFAITAALVWLVPNKK